MSNDAAQFTYADGGRLADPEEFATFLAESQGKPVVLDADGATMITSLHLQLQIAAERQWQAAGIPFDIINISDAFGDSMALLGWQPLET